MDRKSNAEKIYQKELQIRRLTTYVSYPLIFIFTALLIMVFSGDRFNGILHFFGLSGLVAQEGGVYADCSREGNRGNRFCGGSSHRVDQDWTAVRSDRGGRNVPFELSR